MHCASTMACCLVYAGAPGVARWCSGTTGFPFVDASMRQLAATGWMSNRGRQNVASFLAKALQLDWRLGEQLRWGLWCHSRACACWPVHVNMVPGAGTAVRVWVSAHTRLYARVPGLWLAMLEAFCITRQVLQAPVSCDHATHWLLIRC
jgi:hypothetical protein